MSSTLCNRYNKMLNLLENLSCALIVHSNVEKFWFSVDNMNLFVNLSGNNTITVPFNVFVNKELLNDFCFHNKIQYFKYEKFFDLFLEYYFVLSIVGTKTFLGIEKFEILNEEIDWVYLMKAHDRIKIKKRMGDIYDK